MSKLVTKCSSWRAYLPLIIHCSALLLTRPSQKHHRMKKRFEEGILEETAPSSSGSCGKKLWIELHIALIVTLAAQALFLHPLLFLKLSSRVSSKCRHGTIGVYSIWPSLPRATVTFREVGSFSSHDDFFEL